MKNLKLVVFLIAIVLSGCSSTPIKVDTDFQYFMNSFLSSTDKRLTPVAVKTPEYPKASSKIGVVGFCRVSYSVYPYSSSLSILTKERVSKYKTFNIHVDNCNVEGDFKTSCFDSAKSWMFVASENQGIKESEVFSSDCKVKPKN